MFAWFKRRWGLKSSLDVLIVLVVFSLAGSSLVYVRRPVWQALGITASSPFWVKLLAILFITIPLYQVMLLLWGVVFGKARFFWEFEKKTWGRMVGRRSRKSSSTEPRPEVP